MIVKVGWKYFLLNVTDHYLQMHRIFYVFFSQKSTREQFYCFIFVIRISMLKLKLLFVHYNFHDYNYIFFVVFKKALQLLYLLLPFVLWLWCFIFLAAQKEMSIQALQVLIPRKDPLPLEVLVCFFQVS